MSLVILLTGKQGSGKSYLSRSFKETATIIEVDRLLVGSTEFDFWERTPPHERIDLLIGALQRHYSNLPRHAGPVIIEGAILCNRWFADSMLESLRQHMGRNIAPGDVRRYYLNPLDEQIFENVRRRAIADPKRRHESDDFECVADVTNRHKHFDDVMNRSENADWISQSDSGDLAAIIERFIKGI